MGIDVISSSSSSSPPGNAEGAPGVIDDYDDAGHDDLGDDDDGGTTTTTTTTTRATKEESTGEEGTSATKKKKEKERKSPEESSDLSFTWICSGCREAECLLDPDSPLVLCDGPCGRPYHPHCANIVRLPPDDVPWICEDCNSGAHACLVCGTYGKDGIDVHKCDARGCGLFYHEGCLGSYDVDVVLVEGEEAVVAVGDGDGDDDDEGEDDDGRRAEVRDGGAITTTTRTPGTRTAARPRFKCPAHQCWTCSSGRPVDGPPVVCTPTSPADGGTTETKGSGGRGGGRKRKGVGGGGGGGGGGGASSALWAAKKERLFRCLDCPVSYHITCMPPSCRFHELAMLCHEHAYTSKLPFLDEEYSFQACVEADADRRIRRLERVAEKAALRPSCPSDDDIDDDGGGWAGSRRENAFLPGLVGSAVTFDEERLAEFLDGEYRDDDNDDDNGDGDEDNFQRRKRKKRRQFNYCLPLDFKELVHSKPPTYTHVNANRYDPRNRPKRHPPSGESCQCKPSAEEGIRSCGEGCMNRLNYVECVGDRTLKTGEKNPYWNCNCGPACGNRAMSQRQFAKCRPTREHGKGWGLVTVNGVSKGDLIQEYVGEIIDEKTKDDRLLKWSHDHPNDPNFYIMHLEPSWYIDAREVANMARFINHSCDPNCKLLPVNVAGRMRVSIVCIRDVPPGGFLSYDYQFDTRFGDKFICRCGAANCRGTMKGGKTEEKAEKKTKKQLLFEAKARVQRDKKFLQGVMASEKDRLHLTGPFVPGSDVDKAEMVAGGPQERYRHESRGIFLWRNARAGADFSSRYWKSVSRKRGEVKMRKSLHSHSCEDNTVDVISFVNGKQKHTHVHGMQIIE